MLPAWPLGQVQVSSEAGSAGSVSAAPVSTVESCAPAVSSLSPPEVLSEAGE